MGAVEAGFAEAGEPLPDRRYVANGDQQVVIDCEQVTVAAQFMLPYGGNVAAQSVPSKHRDVASQMRVVMFAIQIARCAPALTTSSGDPRLPTPSEEDDSSLVIYSDPVIAWNGLTAAYRAGGLVSCNSIAFIDTVWPGTAGGFASSKLRVQIGLE